MKLSMCLFLVLIVMTSILLMPWPSTAIRDRFRGGRPVGATEGIFMYHQIVHPVAKTEYGRVIKKTAQSQMNAVIVNSGVLVQCEILLIIVSVCINSF